MTAHAAMDACFAAWQRQNMQLPLELDETPTHPPHTARVGGLVEPERLTTGAEPCCDVSGELGGSVAAPPATSGGSAPSPPPER